MTCNIDYQLKFFDEQGGSLFEFDDYLQFQLNRNKNDIGTLNITLPGQNYTLDQFKKDYRCEVWRKGKLVGKTCWFLMRVEKSFIGATKETAMTLTFSDTIELISRRYNTNFSTDTPQSAGHLEGQCDDIIKILAEFSFGTLVTVDNAVAPTIPIQFSPILTTGGIPNAVTIAYQNLGGGVPTNRPLPIDIEGYKSEGVVLAKNTSFLNLLNTYQDLANNSYVAVDLAATIEFYNNLWFDIEYTPKSSSVPAHFLLKTWVGLRNNDLRGVKSIGPDFNNMQGATYVDDWTNRADIAYVLGDGDHNLQTVGGVSLDTAINGYYYSLPFGPVEITADYTEPATDTPGVGDPELIAQGSTALGQRAITKSMDGTIVNTGDFDFITDYDYGDIMLMKWGDISEIVEISEFEISVSGNTENISVPLNLLTR